MSFVKEFAAFLYEKQAIKFGDFTLASGKKSPYYIDLRLLPSFPHMFRKTIKNLQNKIIEESGLESFDTFVSLPTGGLVVTSALAIETVKPMIYVRSKSKEYGTSKLIEGITFQGMNALMVDDVCTTGSSVLKAIEELKKEQVNVKDVYVVVDRLEGGKCNMEPKGLQLHSLVNIEEITKSLLEQGKVNNTILKQVQERIR